MKVQNVERAKNCLRVVEFAINFFRSYFAHSKLELWELRGNTNTEKKINSNDSVGKKSISHQLTTAGPGAADHWLPSQNSARPSASNRAGTPTERNAAI